MSQDQHSAEQAPDLNNELKTRREKLAQLREKEAVAFPNDFRRDAVSGELHENMAKKRGRAGSPEYRSGDCRPYDDPPYHG